MVQQLHNKLELLSRLPTVQTHVHMMLSETLRMVANQ